MIFSDYYFCFPVSWLINACFLSYYNNDFFLSGSRMHLTLHVSKYFDFDYKLVIHVLPKSNVYCNLHMPQSIFFFSVHENPILFSVCLYTVTIICGMFNSFKALECDGQVWQMSFEEYGPWFKVLCIEQWMDFSNFQCWMNWYK